MSETIQLRDPRPTKIIALPSFPGSEVEVWPSLLAKDVNALVRSDDAVSTGLSALHLHIKRWNFNEPVSKDKVLELPMTDVEFLLTTISAFRNEQKKS